MVEVPPLELEPDFETEEPTAPGGRRSGAIDLSLDDQTGDAGERSSLVFGGMDATSAQPTIQDLEARVADDPDDPEAHQALGEALIEEGERERGIEELDLATTGFENLGNLPQARDLVRSEEHTSELQSRLHLVCRLLLEKKKTRATQQHYQSN